MPSYRSLAILGLATLLVACQSPVPQQQTTPLSAQRILDEQRPEGCQGDRCPLVNVDTFVFPTEPALNALIDERLRRMTQYGPDDAIPVSLDAYRQRFLSNAEPGWSTYLQAKPRDQHGDLVVIELSSYLYQGGAHGMPGRGFINYDLERNRAVTLEDALLPGQEAAFWGLAEEAHQAWLDGNVPEEDADFADNWPFQRTDHVAFLKDSVLLKYDVYSLGPYSMGHPELSIPYSKLDGVLKPDYLP
ncbi:DUF3298 domain-containing protein [Stutzerimonas urumqiensis]